MGRRRKRGSEQTGLGGVGKIRVRLVDARTDEQAHNMVALGSKPLELTVNWF